MARGRNRRLQQALAGAGSVAPATPETVAKLRHDVVGRLLRSGRLMRPHALAAEEIRLVAEAVSRGMFPTARPTEWTGRVPDHRLPRDFLDRMTARERHLWQFRYLPWSRSLRMAEQDGLPGRIWLGLVLGIVVDNWGLRYAERCHNLRNGAAVGLLARGLERYGCIGPAGMDEGIE